MVEMLIVLAILAVTFGLLFAITLVIVFKQARIIKALQNPEMVTKLVGEMFKGFKGFGDAFKEIADLWVVPHSG
jgi:hypothetical protein